jgi:hypothetical protein
MLAATGLLGIALFLGSGVAVAQESGRGADKSDSKKEPKAPDQVPADQKIIYRVDLNGELGRNISQTPLKQALDDAKKWNPDYLVFYVNMSFSVNGRSRKDWQSDPGMTGQVFNQLETARHLQTMFTDEIRDSADWKTRDGKKPQLIMWVKRAMGGAAFLPFVAPTIYYTSDAHHGGIGFLDHMFDGVGDYEVRQKQYSLRVARLVGLAEKGGHEGKLVRAMTRLDYVLSVSYVGGKPVFFEDYSGDELLTDDGNPEAGRADGSEEIIRMEGNDVLTVDADKAIKLGLGAAKIDTVDELANELGVSRNFVVIEGRSDDIIARWAKEVSGAERDLEKMWRDFSRVRIEGATASERNQQRSKQLSLLNKISSLFNRYREAVNPRNVEGAPPNWTTSIDVMVAEIKQEIRLDR